MSDPADPELVFHDDCWQAAQVEVQASYRDHVREHGIAELLSVYGRRPASTFVVETHPITVEAEAMPA